MAERADGAAFAVARVGGARGDRPIRPAIAIVALFATIAGIGWITRPPAEERHPPTATAGPRPSPTAVRSPADSVVLGGRHPNREHGTDGLLGGIVFGGATEP
ncbi:MAG TPA: hypothetical protein VFK54_06075 [Candidatus Limnocylindrales bacterium]|nr:hypothetical protein [Candidatus Limnocylindrales bacterium]